MFEMFDQVNIAEATIVCNFGYGIIVGVGVRTARVYWIKSKKETLVPFSLLQKST